MKTNTFITSVFTFCLVIFAAASGISNPAMDNTGDIMKKADNKSVTTVKNESASADAVNDFSYLRFDVNEYSNESAVTELPVSSFEYLRFDINNFVNENETMEMELPASNEFIHLRFDVNDFIESYPVEMSELPVNEYEYLTFDVNKFASQSEGSIDELPITE